MYEVTVEAHFSSGHYLREYYGKCENPHGHNYRVLVTLAGAELEPNGLLLDFKVLKDILKPVVNYLDHQMINDLEPFTVLLRSNQRKAVGRDRRPGSRQAEHDLRDGHLAGDLLRVSDAPD